jgi:hypothetical protein
MPELCLRDDELPYVWSQVAKSIPNAMLLAGIGTSSVDDKTKPAPGSNQVVCVLPFKGDADAIVSWQDKHHRWMLGKSQILQYGLSQQLDPEVCYWENTRIPKREIKFIELTPWLTLCPLICEDLARQDPISEIIRSVGPNLVIALLLDGPQLASRWSAKYASVLADDPGCSVLSLTSIGMSRLCTCLGKPESRVIALWKDAETGGPYEIGLPCDAEAVVISLELDKQTEWTADGRSDGESSGYWLLKAVHPVRIRK